MRARIGITRREGRGYLRCVRETIRIRGDGKHDAMALRSLQMLDCWKREICRGVEEVEGSLLAWTRRTLGPS